MTTLLDFHKHVLEAIHDPATNDLLVIGRGLGLRRVVCTLLKMYDSPKTLILLLGASPEEETAIGEELGLMGCRRPGLRVLGYETSPKERQKLYIQGGLISVTTRILIVDMLLGQIPTELITGLLVLHAEHVNALSPEAFIARLYREKNKKGFLKAFTDQPERITSGLSPLKNIMKELHVRTVHIYPRYHEEIKENLEEGPKANVVEIAQKMTEAMKDIHNAIIACMTATLAELKRSNAGLDIDDLKVENAYFSAFNVIIRRQLDAVWAKVGPKTRQLVSDLGTLRELLQALLTYDALQFQALIDTIIAANSYTTKGTLRQNQSLWVMSDPGNLIFELAKRRCYVTNPVPVKKPQVIDLVDDEEDWAILDEIEQGPNAAPQNKGKSKDTAAGDSADALPEGLVPVLEELPKWDLLADVLQEIEEEIIRLSSIPLKPGQLPPSNLVLVMASSSRTSNLLREYLDTTDHSAPKGQKGRRMMMRKLKAYLYYKRKEAEEREAASKAQNNPRWHGNPVGSKGADGAISEALRRKDKEIAARNQNRRRVRGGAPAGGIPKPEPKDDNIGPMQTEIETLLNSSAVLEAEALLDLTDVDLDNDEIFTTYFGLVPPESTVIVRPYSDDSDDRMLADLKPTFIVLYEPDMDFVRRIEVYKATHPGLGVRVYQLYYSESSEEHKYLAGLRKENDAFKRLIVEKATMVLTIDEHSFTQTDAILKTISTRYAGGRRDISLKEAEMPRIVVDMREFRSALPSLLHAAHISVVPATLRTGDYVLTPDICVERKSIPDLLSSFNSGRLYTQCEMMSAYYKYPVLLIEFEEDKAFSLEIINETVSHAKQPPGGGGGNSKYPPKKPGGEGNEPPAPHLMLQSKLVLLTLSFPRLRIIWSSSPFATAEIFSDLKANQPEPDVMGAISTGADTDDPELGAGVNSAAEELLRSLPGVRTEEDVRKVMKRVKCMREFCELSEEEVKEVLGEEKGKLCWEFMHRGEETSNPTTTHMARVS